MKRTALLSRLLPCLLIAACGGDDDDSADDGAAGEGPVYALATQVYSVDDRTVYVSLADTADLTEVDLDSATERNGVANLAAIGGALYISDGEEPIITRYDIDDSLGWTERGSISFADYPLGDNANFFYQYVLDEHTVYLPYEATRRVVWDPTEMAIVGAMEDSSLALEEDGLLLEPGGNRSGVAYDGAVLQPLFRHDQDWFEFGASSYIASYDPSTHEEARVIEAPCPGLAVASRAEDGTTYFSSWDYLPALALFGDGPPPCAVRVGPDGELDEAWTTDLTDLTEGRYVVNLRHVGGGKAIGNVLHDELIEGIDFEGDYDPAITDYTWTTGPHWKLWLFDLEAGAAEPIEGIDVAIGSGAGSVELDGRTFLTLPYDDWSRTKVYELGDDGVAQLQFDAPGEIFRWVRVR